MNKVLECIHDSFCSDAPTEKEINIFRLYRCHNCGSWISLVGVVRNDEQYNEIEQKGFDRAFNNILWRRDK